ncbi:MAG: DUF3516 domain-containing protein, partial [Planctomycetaceae bacterium]|nr:DUF3516 domain-containing protein [Planctomycetaceae bacterium]
LVTGNRRVNPDARCLVVVAEILLNRLLHGEEFRFDDVASVVMDEFHSFNDPERGVVWELSLALLPKHVRLLLLSATVGQPNEFLIWLHRSHGRSPQLVQSTDRKVPLQAEWVGDRLLSEQLEWMTTGDADLRRTPTLLFCFNRSECWSVAEQLKGKSLLLDGQQKILADLLDKWDFKSGIGPKLKPLLQRGVGVHHAGMLPKYRRRVEELFQQKLLSVCVCTETLAAGINLPARSVVLTTLMKGPPGKKKLIEPSALHQMMGRAGRPQFDRIGFVYTLAHEDDVRIARWKKQYDQIPEDTKDPNLIRAKKALKKKQPTRRNTEQYWNEDQFKKLIALPPAKLASRGELPWRLLAYLLQISPDVARLRAFVNRRLLDPKALELNLKRLEQMVLTLWSGGYVDLEPPPPMERPAKHTPVANPALVKAVSVKPQVSAEDEEDFGGDLLEKQDSGVGIRESGKANTVGTETESSARAAPHPDPLPGGEGEEAPPGKVGAFGALLQQAMKDAKPQASPEAGSADKKSKKPSVLVRALGLQVDEPTNEPPPYTPHRATPTADLSKLLMLRSVNPVYGLFLLDLLGAAEPEERIQALESVLELPGSLLPFVRVPKPDVMPPGPLATGYVDQELIARGLATQEELYPPMEEDRDRHDMFRERRWPVPLADKLRLLFHSEFPDVRDLRITPCWVVGDLLQFNGEFDKYVRGRDLTKQEGLVFRHCLRMILLCGEFAALTPPNVDAEAWQHELHDISRILTESCRSVDPESTDKALESMATGDIVEVDRLERR